MLLRGHGRDHHRRLGLAEELTHHRADSCQRLFEPCRRHGRRAIPEALQRREVGRRHCGIFEQHVNEGRRKEGVGHPPVSDEPQELAKVGLRHDDDAAAESHHRQAENARRVGEGREREIDRPAVERIAHQRQRRHRLEVAARQHHAFRLPGRPPCAGDHGDIVERRDVHRIVGRAFEPARERRRGRGRPVQANQDRELRQVGDHALDQRFIGAVKDERPAVEGVEDIAVLLGFVARIDRTPHCRGARDPENAGESDRIVARQNGDLVARRNSGSSQGARHAIGVTLDLGIGKSRVSRREARRVFAERSALVEIVGEPHRQSSGERARGSRARERDARPASSRFRLGPRRSGSGRARNS